MPNITEYNAGAGGLTPSEQGINANLTAARRVGSFYHQLGEDIGGTTAQLGVQYQQQLTRHEVSAGSAALANLYDQQSSLWNEAAANADPNDIHLADRYRQGTLEPALQAFQKNFTTKEGQTWAADQVAHFRQHMFEKTAADQSTLAGNAVSQNLMTLKNRASNMTMNDPSSFDAVAGLIDNSIDAQVKSHPNINADTASRMKQELAVDFKGEAAKSAVIGAIQKDPTAGRALLSSGKFNDYLDGSQVKTLDSYADSMQKAQAAQARAAQAEEVKAQKADFAKRSSLLTGSTIQADGSLGVPPDYFKNVANLALHPGAEPGQIRAMIDYGQSLANKEAKPVDDPHTYEDFSHRMTLPASDPHALSMTDVFQARAAGMLTDKSFTFFKEATEIGDRDPGRKEANKQMDRFLTDMKPSITKSNIFSGQIYPEQDQRYSQFQYDMHMAMDLRIKNGESPAAVAADLLDARSPHYLGRFIPQYAIGSKQGQAMMANSLQNGVQVVPAVGGARVAAPARLPNESPGAYLARTAGKGGGPAPAPARPAPAPAPKPAAQPALGAPGQTVVDTSYGNRQSVRAKIKR